MRLGFALLLIAGLAIGSCSNGPTGGVDHAAARAAVERYFAAANGKDCATIMAMMPSVKTAENCQEYLGQWHEEGNQLEEVLEVTGDSRDRNAAIVLVRMRAAKGERQIRIRAVRGPGGYTIVF
jgi:hypothetical protein